MNFRCSNALLLAVSVLCYGCGKQDGKLQVYSTSGQLSLDGDTFGPTSIQLLPMEKGGRTAVGEVDASGKVVFTTYQVGDGLPAGLYRVAVGIQLGEPPRPFPAIYRDFVSSPLQISVDSVDGNTLKLDMKKSAGPMVKSAKASGKLLERAFQSEGFAAGAKPES